MKTILFFLLLGTCVPAFASAPVVPLITRTTINANSVKVMVANLERERTVIQLADLTTNDKLFGKVIKEHNGYSVNLSLDQLPEGRYVITITKGDTVRRQIIWKSETGIQCSEWR